MFSHNTDIFFFHKHKLTSLCLIYQKTRLNILCHFDLRMFRYLCWKTVVFQDYFIFWDATLNATTLWIEDFLLQFRTFVQEWIKTLQAKALFFHAFVNFVIWGFLAFIKCCFRLVEGKHTKYPFKCLFYCTLLYCHFLKNEFVSPLQQHLHELNLAVLFP